eukprot:4198879-Pyramimonas_sp.AAC.1
MDQAKFKCPRNMESAKMFSTLWRPTLHNVGIICEGVCEIYLVMPADEAKGSNMEISSLAHALDLCNSELTSKGLRMPDHLSVTYDNTGREGKQPTYGHMVSLARCIRQVQVRPGWPG